MNREVMQCHFDMKERVVPISREGIHPNFLRLKMKIKDWQDFLSLVGYINSPDSFRS